MVDHREDVLIYRRKHGRELNAIIKVVQEPQISIPSDLASLVTHENAAA